MKKPGLSGFSSVSTGSQVVRKINTVKTKDAVTIIVNGRVREYQKAEIASLMAQLANQFSRPVIDVVNEAFIGLMKSRDFLGLQLDHAWGNLPDAEFEALSEEHLSRLERGVSPKELERKVEILLTITSIPLDAEILSEMFSCPLETAQACLNTVVDRWNHNQIPPRE